MTSEQKTYIAAARLALKHAAENLRMAQELILAAEIPDFPMKVVEELKTATGALVRAGEAIA